MRTNARLRHGTTGTASATLARKALIRHCSVWLRCVRASGDLQAFCRLAAATPAAGTVTIQVFVRFLRDSGLCGGGGGDKAISVTQAVDLLLRVNDDDDEYVAINQVTAAHQSCASASPAGAEAKAACVAVRSPLGLGAGIRRLV